MFNTDSILFSSEFAPAYRDSTSKIKLPKGDSRFYSQGAGFQSHLRCVTAGHDTIEHPTHEALSVSPSCHEESWHFECPHRLRVRIPRECQPPAQTALQTPCHAVPSGAPRKVPCIAPSPLDCIQNFRVASFQPAVGTENLDDQRGTSPRHYAPRTDAVKDSQVMSSTFSYAQGGSRFPCDGLQGAAAPAYIPIVDVAAPREATTQVNHLNELRNRSAQNVCCQTQKSTQAAMMLSQHPSMYNTMQTLRTASTNAPSNVETPPRVHHQDSFRCSPSPSPRTFVNRAHSNKMNSRVLRSSYNANVYPAFHRPDQLHIHHAATTRSSVDSVNAFYIPGHIRAHCRTNTAAANPYAGLHADTVAPSVYARSRPSHPCSVQRTAVNCAYSTVQAAPSLQTRHPVHVPTHCVSLQRCGRGLKRSVQLEGADLMEQMPWLKMTRTSSPRHFQPQSPPVYLQSKVPLQKISRQDVHFNANLAKRLEAVYEDANIAPAAAPQSAHFQSTLAALQPAGCGTVLRQEYGAREFSFGQQLLELDGLLNSDTAGVPTSVVAPPSFDAMSCAGGTAGSVCGATSSRNLDTFAKTQVGRNYSRVEGSGENF